MHDFENRTYLTISISVSENACVQEDSTGADLPDLKYHPPQLCGVDRHLSHVLLRVRRPAVGDGETGGQVYRMRS